MFSCRPSMKSKDLSPRHCASNGHTQEHNNSSCKVWKVKIIIAKEDCPRFCSSHLMVSGCVSIEGRNLYTQTADHCTSIWPWKWSIHPLTFLIASALCQLTDQMVVLLPESPASQEGKYQRNHKPEDTNIVCLLFFHGSPLFPPWCSLSLSSCHFHTCSLTVSYSSILLEKFLVVCHMLTIYIHVCNTVITL